MNDKLIEFEEEVLKKKLKTYEEDLKTNYLIVRREEATTSEMEFELGMDQYDLFHIETQKSLMVVTIFPDLGLVEAKFSDSEVVCALTISQNQSLIELENISIDEIEKMISYIQFTETKIYSDTLEFMPSLSQIKDSALYEKYLQVLISIQCGITSIAKLYI